MAGTIESKLRSLAYHIVRVALLIFYKLFFNFKTNGIENVPRESDKRGLILAPNHASFIDPPIVAAGLRRRVIFLAKEYLFRKFIVGAWLRTIETLPIKTEVDDFRSIRELIRILKNGKCIMVFPEGTRTPDGELKEPESGIGFLAIKSQAYVLPVYIQGSYEAFPKGKKFFRCKPVKVHYGKPFVPAMDKELTAAEDPYAAVSRKIMDRIKEIKARVEKV
jgi:1-acyl-sn-glycerol-3-phosphate acyltransferase